MQQPISPAHPSFTSLVARWSLSSCSASNEELDLSGHGRHLKLERGESNEEGSTACWSRLAPTRFTQARTDFIVETLQDSSFSDSECRFLIKIKHRAQYQRMATATHASQQQQTHPQIVFVCNFRCFKSTSVTNSGEGKWIIALLKECIRGLPENTSLGILRPSAAGNQQLVLSPLTRMTATGKVHCLFFV